MKEFNLQEYLKNPDRKIVTRDGRSVRIICTDKEGSECSIVALVKDKNEEKVNIYYPNGVVSLLAIDDDLFFAPEKKECAFKKGDRVLVRDSLYERWQARIFGEYIKDSKYQYWCEDDDNGYRHCIPYNEHTWQLLNTTD